MWNLIIKLLSLKEILKIYGCIGIFFRIIFNFYVYKVKLFNLVIFVQVFDIVGVWEMMRGVECRWCGLLKGVVKILFWVIGQISFYFFVINFFVIYFVNGVYSGFGDLFFDYIMGIVIFYFLFLVFVFLIFFDIRIRWNKI